MKTHNNKYRGYNIHIEEVNADRVDYRIERSDKTIVEETEGFDVTVDAAMEICKSTIDDIVDSEE